MDQYLRAAAAVLLAVVVCLTVGKQGKDMAVILSIAVCCMVIMVAIAYLRPVMEFLEQLESVGNLDRELTGAMFKIAGIGIMTEIAALVCADSGNASLGKALQLLGAAVILWLSIPMFNALMELIQRILGAT